MKVLPPITVDESNLITSNVPDNNYSEYSNTATYAPGDRVQITSEKSVYECVIAEGTTVSGVSPLDDTDPASWLRVFSMNKWRMFDKTITDATTYSASVTWNGETKQGIYIEIQPSKVINGLAFFGVNSPRIYVEVEDPIDGVIYENQLEFVDNSSVVNWYEYFFSDIDRRTERVLLDLPQYANTTIRILIESNSNSDAEIKELVLGRQIDFGCVMYGINLGIQDFSRKERDVFGNPVLVKRNFSKNATFDLRIETNEVDFVNKTLQRYRAQPVVYIVVDRYDSSIIYGFYRDFSTVLPSFNISRCQLELEGLNET